jgi:hypothetical protein
LIVCDPGASELVVTDAVAEFGPTGDSGPELIGVTPSKNDTLPVGTPNGHVTVAVNVTVCPKFAGLGTATTDVELPAGLIVSEVEP